MNRNKLSGLSKGKLVYWNLVTLSKTTPLVENTLNYSTIQGPEEENHSMDYQNKSHNQT